MTADFEQNACRTWTASPEFGLCDDPHPARNPAFIDEVDSSRWIAVVRNDRRASVAFTAIDNCIDVQRIDGRMDKRCDGMLSQGETVAFVELKQRDPRRNAWVEDGVEQLRTTIRHFENTEAARAYRRKKAYVANRLHPEFKASQMGRMQRFFDDTGYVLRIEATVHLE